MANDPIDLSAGLQSTAPQPAQASTTPAPAAQPTTGAIDLSAGLVPAQTPAAAPKTAPIDLSAGITPSEPTPATGPVSEQTHGIMDSLSKQVIQPLEKMVTGPGTMLGKDTAGPSIHYSPIPGGTYIVSGKTGQPISLGDAWKETKLAMHNTLDTSLIVPENAFTAEEKAAHPHLAAAAQGVSNVIKGLTTPGNIALILATEGADAIPAALEKTLGGFEATAPYAIKAAKAAKLSLQGMGVYFTTSQIADVMHSVPEIAQAVMTGQTDKAIELATSAFVNGVVATKAGHDTYQSIHGSVSAAAENSAMKHQDYADIVHDRQKTLQVAGGQKNQVADLGREVAPNVKDREWATEYVEAEKNRDILKQRQAQTLAGPTPTEVIEEHAGTPVYHGTAAANSIEELAADRSAAQGVAGPGVYLSRTPEVASEYVKNTPEARVLGGSLAGKAKLLDAAAPLPADVLKAAGLPENLSYSNALDEIRKGAENLEEATPKIKELQKAIAEKGYHGVDNIFPGQRDALLVFGDDVLPENERYKDLVKNAVPYKSRPPIEASATPATPEELATPAAQHALELQTAIHDAREAAKAHVITPEERAAMAEQQDPDRKLSAKHQKAIDFVTDKMDMIKQEAQQRGLLPKGQLRDNFVPHEYDFEDTSDPTKARLYDTYHEAQQAGLAPKNKDFFALTSDYMGKMWNKIADADTINKLKSGRTRDGAPLAVPGGFVEGQRVSAEGPQSHVLTQQELQKLGKAKLTDLIKSGRVVPNENGSAFTLKADDYVKAKNLYEVRPIGPTPIPPNVLAEMRANGSLDALQKKGLVYEGVGADGKKTFFNKENLYARVPVYLHPDIAEHFNEVVKPKTEEPTSKFGKLMAYYDDVTGNMKSLLLSWSPFHRVTESMRMMEGLGIVKGGKLAAETNLGLAPKVDYFNLTPSQEAAIRDGIVTSDPRGRSASNVEEGLSAGQGNSWGPKTYRLFDKGLEKLGVPVEIRNKVNLQKILTEDVFGPQGMITNAKFALYDQRKPEIASQIAKDHPNWSPQEIDRHAGTIAARFANDKFGGLNNILMGRTLQDQKVLRRLLLAPDFLESTGRSVLDLADKYGSNMVSKLIAFNAAHLLTAAGINYALHHKDEDDTTKGAVNASHILDHPYGVVSADGKTVYGLRTTMTDFLHMINKPRDFAYNRVNPFIRATDEVAEQRNQYGRKESLGEAAKAFPKAALPIQVQNAVGLGPNTTTEPSARDQFMKSIGIQARPNRTNAEQLAIDKVSAHLQGQEARTGQALVRQQLKFNAEDNLRAAYATQDPEKRKAAIAAAKHDVQNLAYRKIIDAEEVKKINTDAQGSRLKSIFTSLEPMDALDVWDASTDAEKKELDVAMNSKYLRWRENLAKHGQNINSLNAEDEDVLNRFIEASKQAAEIKNRPETAPKQKTEKAEKASAPAIDLSAGLVPASVAPPKAPEVYKTGDYTGLINDTAKKYDVDPTLIQAMVKQESAGDPNAVSKKNAHGLLQLEPITAKQYGVTNINDPVQNIEAGVHYMADLLKEYGGDEEKALAAYNAGPTAVNKYGGVPPYAETKDYVKKITGRNNP